MLHRFTVVFMSSSVRSHAGLFTSLNWSLSSESLSSGITRLTQQGHCSQISDTIGRKCKGVNGQSGLTAFMKTMLIILIIKSTGKISLCGNGD